MALERLTQITQVGIQSGITLQNINVEGANVSGVVTATSLNVTGSGANFAGVVTATTFVGNVTGNINPSTLVVTGVSTFQASSFWGDGDIAYFGDGQDLLIWHNSTDSIIRDNGTGDLCIEGGNRIKMTNPTGIETYAVFNQDGAVELWFDNSKKLETTGAGVTVTGIITASNGIVVSAGSTSAPSISPTGDSNTGIFFPSADTIAFAEGGVEAARFDSGGRLGIGTNNPTGNGNETTIHVSAPSYPVVHLTNNNTGSSASDGSEITLNDDGSFIIRNRENSFIRFDTNGSERVRIDSSGRVTKPSQPAFQAYGDGSYTTYSVNAEITKFTFTTYNIGSHYNPTTCRFTAPVAGVYLFTATVLTETDQAGSLTFAINGTDATAQARMYMSAERGRSNSILLQLAVNDYVSLFARDNNLRIYGPSYSGFSGVLLG